ncbi:MAG: SCP2 sterol-binding domain-containing protein [Candidatus Thorarchaeota archaeon]
MPTSEELVASLEKMVGKIELPKNKKRFENYNKILQIEFTNDSESICHIVFYNGNATIIDGIEEAADMTITTTTDVLMDVINGTVSPTRAFMSGKIKAKGPLPDLMKLQALLK